jgi:hypothetical protein
MSTLVRIQQSNQVLIGTGIGQIKYLNRALIRFDSKASRTRAYQLYPNVMHCRSLFQHNLFSLICLQ